MAESTTTPTAEGTTAETQGKAQAGSADQSGRAFEPITSQEEFDRRIKARIDRVKSTPPADYEDLKAKAARLDELEQQNKSELEKAQDAAAKAKAKAGEWKARFEELQAEQERSRAIAEAASEHGVDADMLSRMSGDVVENARFLAEREAARPKYGDVADSGDGQAKPVTVESILAEPDRAKRQRLIAENLGLFN